MLTCSTEKKTRNWRETQGKIDNNSWKVPSVFNVSGHSMSSDNLRVLSGTRVEMTGNENKWPDINKPRTDSGIIAEFRSALFFALSMCWFCPLCLSWLFYVAPLLYYLKHFFKVYWDNTFCMGFSLVIPVVDLYWCFLKFHFVVVEINCKYFILRTIV